MTDEQRAKLERAAKLRRQQTEREALEAAARRIVAEDQEHRNREIVAIHEREQKRRKENR